MTQFYAGGDSKVASASRSKESGFKRGGKAKKSVGNVHGEAAAQNAGRAARKEGGRVLSSASGGTPRKAAEHY